MALHLPGKQTFRAHGRQVVVFKRPNESARHVVMKVLLWALYLPEHDGLTIEAKLEGHRYRPDVLALDAADGEPVFWGELGQVKADKIRALARKHPRAHLVIGKWSDHTGPHEPHYRAALAGVRRRAPVDLIAFPKDSVERFFREDGSVAIAPADVTTVRLLDPA